MCSWISTEGRGERPREKELSGVDMIPRVHSVLLFFFVSLP